MGCHCGNESTFDACCGLLISGDAQAETAEALMRARYSAYVTGDIDFIIDTQKVDGDETDREATEAWSRDSTWLGLEILKVEDGEALHDRGTIEFIARYSHKEDEQAHHEVATFRKKDGRWEFVDAKMKNSTFRRTTPKVKPNEPCPCGSGKKFKKCCGKP